MPDLIQPNFVPPLGKAGKYTNKIHHIKMFLLEELPHYDFSLPFMEPVNAKRLRVPHYYTIIDHPMDMGTISKRVAYNYYHNVNELIYDIRLVIRNCFTFNTPGSPVYRNGQDLEKLFLQVYYSMPKGEEVPFSKEEAEKSLAMHQCRCRLRKLREETEELEQDAQELFGEKWLPVAEALNNQSIQSQEDFDARFHKILTHCKEHSKRILDTYDYESSQICGQGNRGAENAKDELDYNVRKCLKPPFDWEDKLIDTLDDTLNCLKQELARYCRGEPMMEKFSYSDHLLPIFINGQIIAEGLCSQTYMPDSSEEDEAKSDSNTVDPLECDLIRKQFSGLGEEGVYDAMHIIEQLEYRPDRKYNMPNFGPKTILLVKEAIKRHYMKMEAKARAEAVGNSVVAANNDPAGGFRLPPVSKFYCHPYETSSQDNDDLDLGLPNNYDSDENKHRYYDTSDSSDI